MKKRVLNSLAALFVLIYWLPTMVQLGHHHEELFLCHAENEQHFHVKHQQCDICSFQISFFAIDIPFQISSIERPCEQNVSNKIEDLYNSLPSFNFHLRAPPVLI